MAQVHRVCKTVAMKIFRLALNDPRDYTSLKYRATNVLLYIPKHVLIQIILLQFSYWKWFPKSQSLPDGAGESIKSV